MIMWGRFLLWKLSLQSELSSAYVSVRKHCCPCALAALPLVKSCNGRCFRPTIVHIVFVILYIFKTLSLCGFAVLVFYWSAWRPECLLDLNSCSLYFCFHTFCHLSHFAVVISCCFSGVLSFVIYFTVQWWRKSCHWIITKKKLHRKTHKQVIMWLWRSFLPFLW